MADDLGREVLSSYGGDSYETPRLDALASQGMRFERAYSTPLCTPSRVKIMTGKHSFRNYERFGYLPPEETTFANLLRQAGYATAIAGKWQLGGDRQTPHAFGFDEYLLWQLQEGDYWYRYKNPVLEGGHQPRDTLRGAYGPEHFTRFLNDFIERHRDEPFFAYYPMVLPHRPFQPTPGTEAYGDFNVTALNDTSYFRDMVSYMDRAVGRIADTLDALGLQESTLLIFTGDNGTDRDIYSVFGRRVVRGDKGYPTEAGTHVPLIAHWPGTVEAGSVSGDLVGFTDVLPTLVEAAGAELPADFVADGTSFYPTLTTGAPHPGNWLFFDYPGKEGAPVPARSWAQTRRYKLYDDGRFYNYYRDPEEHRNLQGRMLSDQAREAKNTLQAVLKEMNAQRRAAETQ